jgi:hypothetical protein
VDAVKRNVAIQTRGHVFVIGKRLTHNFEIKVVPPRIFRRIVDACDSRKFQKRAESFV